MLKNCKVVFHEGGKMIVLNVRSFCAFLTPVCKVFSSTRIKTEQGKGEKIKAYFGSFYLISAGYFYFGERWDHLPAIKANHRYSNDAHVVLRIRVPHRNPLFFHVSRPVLLPCLISRFEEGKKWNRMKR